MKKWDIHIIFRKKHQTGIQKEYKKNYATSYYDKKKNTQIE